MQQENNELHFTKGEERETISVHFSDSNNYIFHYTRSGNSGYWNFFFFLLESPCFFRFFSGSIHTKEFSKIYRFLVYSQVFLCPGIVLK